MTDLKIYFAAFSLLFFGCQTNPGKTFSVKEISTPCKNGAAPNLHTSAEGEVYLSWVEYLNDSTDALVYSRFESEDWSAPKEIAHGSDWFVNWADFPSIVSRPDGKGLAAHWLQKSAGGTYDYDVRISQSTDGEKWSKPFISHRDSIAAEHGFVSMLPLSEDRIFAVWLDGRNTKNGDGSDHDSHDNHGHGAGAMTLRTVEFDAGGNLFAESELDARICDCCQTDAAKIDEGVVVVYRDRSEDEVRDISIVRKVDSEWTAPKTVHLDGWKIADCPVNGPAVAASGNDVAVAWFTGANDSARVNFAFSENGGADFQKPFQVDDGDPVGRVDLLHFSNGKFLVSWLETTGDSAAIRTAVFSKKGKIDESRTIAVSNASRRSGFPRMTKSGNDIFMAWTGVENDSTFVETAILKGLE